MAVVTKPPPFAMIILEDEKVPAAVADVPNANVSVPMFNVPDRRVSVPLIVGLAVVLNPPELFNLRLFSVAPDMVAPLPVIVMDPAPVCLPVPIIFPARLMATPLSLIKDPAVSVRFPGILIVALVATVLVPLVLLLVSPPV